VLKKFFAPLLVQNEGEERFYALPDGAGGVYLKPAREVTLGTTAR